MEKKFLRIRSASNEDGSELFNAICKDVLGEPVGEVKKSLGMPESQKATMKDAITLIQEFNLQCDITVTYAVKPAEVIEKDQKKKEEDPLPF